MVEMYANHGREARTSVRQQPVVMAHASMCAMTATITVQRLAVAYMDRMRSYTVVVDGYERAAVKNGESATIALEAGRHTVAMKIDWCGSPHADIDVEQGENHHLRCRPKANPLTGLYYIVAARDRYIALWRAEGSGL